MYLRALRRLVWARYGDPRNPPRPSEAARACIKATYGQRIKLQLEGGAFGRHGWIILADTELGFVSREDGAVSARAIPLDSITETRIERTPLYDYLHVTTRSGPNILRVFKSNRDVVQDLFQQIQMSLGASRFVIDRPLSRALPLGARAAAEQAPAPEPAFEQKAPPTTR
jgi:hypothetical protein